MTKTHKNHPTKWTIIKNKGGLSKLSVMPANQEKTEEKPKALDYLLKFSTRMLIVGEWVNKWFMQIY